MLQNSSTLILEVEGSAAVGVVVIEKVARWLGICVCHAVCGAGVCDGR